MKFGQNFNNWNHCFLLYPTTFYSTTGSFQDCHWFSSKSFYARRFAPGFVSYKKGCTRLAAASDTVYQMLAHGQWFSPGTPASSTTKTGHHDIDEILLKVALNTNNSNFNFMWIFLYKNLVKICKTLAKIAPPLSNLWICGRDW